MATAYTSLLGLALPVTGELSGSWGDTVNDSITSLLDSAISGTTTLSADADVTLTSSDGVADQARQAILLWTAGGSTTRNITAPAHSKAYFVINKTSSTQSIVIRGAGPTTGVTVLAGTQSLVVWNGVDFVEVASGNVDGPASSTDNAVARFDGTTGKLIQNSVVTIADTTGNMAGVGTLGVGAITTSGALTYGGVTLSNSVTGTGSMVLATSPTLVTPALGTPSALVGTNITGTAAGLTAGNVTTNANLTGAVTSTGNATVLGSFSSANLAGALTDETGTGSAVFATSPTLVTPALGTPASGVVTNLTGTASININGTVGATTANTGAFTTLSATGAVTLDAATANGVAFANASKVLTTGSALTFDGSVFEVAPATGVVAKTKQLVLNNFTGEGVGITFSRTTDATEVNAIGTANSNWDLGIFARDNVIFATGGDATYSATTEQMRLTSTGLGIGTSSPAAKLSVLTTGAQLDVSTSASDVTFEGIDRSATSNAVAMRWYARNGDFIWNNGSYSERMRLDASGNLGIGTSSPAGKLDVATTTQFAFAESSSAGVKVGTQGTTGGSFMVQTQSASAPYGSGLAIDGTYSSGTLQSTVNIKAFGVYSGGGYGSSLAFHTSSGTTLSQKMLLDASGNLGLGVTPSAWSGFGKTMEFNNAGCYVGNSGATSMQIGANNYFNGTNYIYSTTNVATRYAQSAGSHLWFTAPSGTAGDAITFTQAMTLDASGNLLVGATSTIYLSRFSVAYDGNAQNGPTFADNRTFAINRGGIVFLAGKYNTAGDYRPFGGVLAAKENATDGNSAGYLSFRTNNNGADTTEYMRLDSSGNLGVGTTSPNSPAGSTQITLHISNSTAGTSPGIHLTNGDTGTTAGDGTLIFVGDAAAKGTTSLNIYNQETSPICFFTATAERARITSGGDLLVGTTSAAFTGKIVTLQATSASDVFTAWNSATTGDNAFIGFYTEAGGTGRGSISYNRAGGLVAYNVTSDYRAKDISGPVTGSGALIDSTPVYMGKMKDATQERPMFIAHEVPAYAHTGEKDAVDADGNPVYQQMDASALIPVMWAEIQSLRQRLAAAGI